jgi:hypothetical protein
MTPHNRDSIVKWSRRKSPPRGGGTDECYMRGIRMNQTELTATQEDTSDFRRWWFKVENHINSELKFVTLSHERLGIFVRMLVVANTESPGVITGSIEDLAFALRLDVEQLEEVLSDLESRGLVAREQDTILILQPDRYFAGSGLNYSESPEGRRERKQRQRQRDREREANLILVEDECHRDMSPSIEEKTREDQRIEDKTTQEEEQTLAFKEKGMYEDDDYSDIVDPPYALRIECEDGEEIPLL